MSNLMPDVIVEVRGGNIVEVYTRSLTTRVIIVDWDNVDSMGNNAVLDTCTCASFSEIPEETKHIILTK